MSNTAINSLSGCINLKLRIIFFAYTSANNVVNSLRTCVWSPSGCISLAAAAVKVITIAAIAYSKNAWNAFLCEYGFPALKSATRPTTKFSVPNRTISTKNVITSLVTDIIKAIADIRAASSIPSITTLLNIFYFVPGYTRTNLLTACLFGVVPKAAL